MNELVNEKFQRCHGKGTECSSFKSGQEEDTGQYSDKNKGKDNLLRETGLCMVVDDERHDGIN